MSHLGLGVPNIFLSSSQHRSSLHGSRAHLLGAGLGAMPGVGHGVRQLALVDMGAPLLSPCPELSKPSFWQPVLLTSCPVTSKEKSPFLCQPVAVNLIPSISCLC